MKIGYASKEVCSIIGISYRQLDYWDSSGFIQPSVAKAKGTGTARMYSFMDLVCLRTAKQLRDSGISLQKIRRSVGYLRSHFPELDSPLADLVFLRACLKSLLMVDSWIYLDEILKSQDILLMMNPYGVGIRRYIPE